MPRARTGPLSDPDTLRQLLATHRTIAATARALGVDPRTVGRAAAAHELPTGQPGRPRTYPELASLRPADVRRTPTPRGTVTVAGEYQRIADELTARRAERAATQDHPLPPAVPKDAVRRAVLPRRRAPRARRHGPAS